MKLSIIIAITITNKVAQDRARGYDEVLKLYIVKKVIGLNRPTVQIVGNLDITYQVLCKQIQKYKES